MIGFEILIQIEPENRKEFLQTLKWFSHPKKRLGDCVERRLFEDVIQTNRYIWVEGWTDSKTLENYIKTARFHSFLGALEVLGNLEEMRFATFSPMKVVNGEYDVQSKIKPQRGGNPHA